MTVPYPYDIDLIAVRPDQKKVILISCSEDWKTKTVEKTLDEFNQYEDYVRNNQELGYGGSVRVEKKVACVEMSERKKEDFLRNGVGVLEFEPMLEALLNLVRHPRAEKRKGVHREPLLWLLQTLDNKGKING